MMGDVEPEIPVVTLSMLTISFNKEYGSRVFFTLTMWGRFVKWKRRTK